MNRITELANELGIDPEAARAALKALKPPKVPRVLELAREDAAKAFEELSFLQSAGDVRNGNHDKSVAVQSALIARKRCVETVKEWSDLNWSRVPDAYVAELLAALGDE
jgi:hypothetical protein